MVDERTTSQSPDPGFVHEALIYRDEAELDEALREFLRAAAAADEPVLVALPTAHLERVRERVAGDAVDARFVNVERVGRNPSCLLPMIEEWVSSHAGRARVVSEVVWPGRREAEAAEALRQEALLNHALAGTEATVLSPFDGRRLDEAVLAGVEMTHPTVLESGRRRASASYRDPESMHFGELWPLPPAPQQASEHPLDGSLADLRHAVAEDPALAALPAERRHDLVFAVNEVATNAVRHGDGECMTRIWSERDEVVIEVSFHTRLEDVLAGCRRPPADARDGRGLWLINQLCDLVELRTDGGETTLRMHIALR
jgi:anti-sigma regulatory factor (Ser/Thr protein kinase)